MALIAFLLWSLFCSNQEADQDYRLIVANKPVKHTLSEWIDRAGMVVIGGIIILFVWMIFSGLGIFKMRLLLWIPAGWAMFTMGFRFLLNRKRGLDWRYISPSNWHDWVFLWLGSIPGRGMYFGALCKRKAKKSFNDIWVSKGYHAGWEPWILWTHRGGTLAYIFEFTVLLASTIAYAW